MYGKTLKKTAIVCFVFWVCGSLSATCSLADISLPKIFSDHMVVQQKSKLTISGSAEPNQKLIVKFAGQELKTTANASGDWSTVVATPAAGGPFELEVAAEEGEPKVVFSDVMSGEVWICSGQSNMEWPVSKVHNAEAEILTAKKFPKLRLFSVAHGTSLQPLDDFSKAVPWQVCSPETVKEFSAAGYFFAREISENFPDVPIGLIDSTWGGTTCEAWVSRPSLEKLSQLEPMLRHWDETDSPNDPNRPANLYNAMIAPLQRFPIRGVIWYQGEANNGRGAQYVDLFPALIDDWRKTFSVGEFPFFFVQLAPFRYNGKTPESLAEVWEAQSKTAQSVANTGMVVTTDIGNIEDIHPKNKQDVGRRLALLALENVYHQHLPTEKQNVQSKSPIFDSMSVEGDRILIKFKHVYDGLKVRDDNPELSWFTICGQDKKFVPAIARIKNESTIEVSAKNIDAPIAVRFAWNDSAQPNLINSANLPASPFRTDQFPLQSEDRPF